MRSRLAAVDARLGELGELARLRKQRLLDALSLCKLLAEADAAEQWVAEKERMLLTMVPAKDIDDVEIMKHRYRHNYPPDRKSGLYMNAVPRRV